MDFDTSDRATTSVAVRPARLHTLSGEKTWISAELARAKTPFLFISDAGTNEVYIYNISTLKIIGRITGFSQPQGECSDKRGNVWITDTNAQIIYEVSHHGQLVNELSDAGGYPVSCAWDPKTGNLAVMNLFGTGSTAGAVLVFPNGSGSPTPYTTPNEFYYNFGGYDPNGNLFFDGRDANGNFMLSELAKGSGAGVALKVSGGTVFFPGMVQWDSVTEHLIVGDQSCGNAYVSCIYALKITGTTGKIIVHTRLKNYAGGSVCDLIQGVEYNGQLFGSDYDFCGDAKSAAYSWPYPRGGAPAHYNDTTVSTPVGATISL